MPEPTPSPALVRLPRAWALAAAAPVALLAGLQSHRLGQATVLALHGDGESALCGTQAACLATLGSPGAEWSGAPAAVWAQPVLLVLVWLLWSGRRAAERGRRARGGAVALAGLLALVSVLALVGGGGLGCTPCLELVGLHLLLFGLVLVPPGGRRPALPLVEDGLVIFLLGLTGIMGFGFSARIQAWRLDHPLDAAQAPVVGEGAVRPAADAASRALVPGLPGTDGLVEVGPVMLPAPSSPSPIDDQDPSVGPLRAAVTAVAFLDLQDPASQRVAWTLMQLEPRYRDRVRFVTKHLPMDASCNTKRRRTAHPRACDVAIALQCASLQGAFEGYRMALLRDPDHVTDADLVAMAGDLGLDLSAFASCRSGELGPEAVSADIAQAAKGPLGDPPWVFVEGRVFQGEVGIASLEAALAVALAERPAGLDGATTALLPAPPSATAAPGPLPAVAVGGLWVDAVEDAVDDQGRAVSQAGAAPWPVDLDQARAACTAAGRHLCSRVEWATACQGAAPRDADGNGDPFDDRRQGRLRPYGDAWQPGWCGEADEPPVAAGSRAGCQSPEGAWDLAGNMAEWVDEGVLMGASGTQDACDAAWTPPGPGWRSPQTGFRCCAEAEPVAASSAALAGPATAPPQLPVAALPQELRAAVGPGEVQVIPWRLDCAACQQALVAAARQAGSGGPRVVALSLDDDVQAAKAWIDRSGMALTAVPDPQARLAGRLGVPGLPWSGRFDASGARLAKDAARDAAEEASGLSEASPAALAEPAPAP